MMELNSTARYFLQNESGRLRAQASESIGFPLNQSRKIGVHLWPLMDQVVNNLGDPCRGSRYGVESFDAECDVVSFFQSMLAPSATFSDQQDLWGYVTSCGSEGNLKGLVDGLARFPEAVVYTSDKAHYSILNAIRYTQLDKPGRHVVVPANGDHELRPDRFDDLLDPSRPAIVMATAGTTMLGGRDNVAELHGIMQRKSIEHYIHLDAALEGMFMPLISCAVSPDFNLPIDSVSISGHKFLGVPFPCGIYMTRFMPRSVDVPYIDSPNSTLFGSRNGLAPIVMKLILDSIGITGVYNEAMYCMRNAEYLFNMLGSLGLRPRRLPHSLIVLFERPRQDTVRRWQLATDGDWAHVVCMQHVSRDLLDRFILDVKRDIETGHISRPGITKNE